MSELERVVKILDRIERDLYSTDPKAPGALMRLDRQERRMATLMWFLNFVGGGSLLTLAGTLYVLLRIAQNFPAASGH